MASEAKSKRPILIDEKDGECEICAGWNSLPRETRNGRLYRTCYECKKQIGNYQNMNGAGFRSPSPHHWHIELIVTTHGGEPFTGKRPYYSELCLECYWKAWGETYPDHDYPPPPMELVQPQKPPRGSLSTEEMLRPVIGDVIEE